VIRRATLNLVDLGVGIAPAVLGEDYLSVSDISQGIDQPAHPLRSAVNGFGHPAHHTGTFTNAVGASLVICSLSLCLISALTALSVNVVAVMTIAG
jgi:hypothetical protein